MDSCDQNQFSKQIQGIYLDLLVDQDEEKAQKIARDLEVPRPTEMFQDAMVDEQGLTEEDCLQRLIEEAMPEK